MCIAYYRNQKEFGRAAELIGGLPDLALTRKNSWQSMPSKILHNLAYDEEFAFFRDSPEYEQLRPLLNNDITI